MGSHKPLNELDPMAIDNGLVINLGSLRYQAPKSDVLKHLQERGFHAVIYWPGAEFGLTDSDLGTSDAGWCWVKFQMQGVAERAKRELNGTMLLGRPIKTGPVKRRSEPRQQARPRGLGSSAPRPSVPATRTIPESSATVSAAPTSSVTKIGSSVVNFLTNEYPTDWFWDPAEPDKLHIAFCAKMERTASEYKRRRLLISPVSAQGPDEKMALVSRQIPSPDERNQEHWAQTFFQVAKQDGIKADIKTIISTDLPKFEAQDYSRYFHPGRPTRKPRDIDERQIKKVNDVFDTDNPVKSSPNLFFIGMMASNLAVKVMPGEEPIARTLPSKDLFELTIPMTEEEKQQVQQERGPKYYWQRGRLTGADAAAEAGISDPSRTFIPPSEMDPNNRSATCSSHMMTHPRPSAAGVGWGGHDRFRQWQLHGRHVKRDIVANEPFSKVLEPTIELITEAGEVTRTVATDVKTFAPDPSLLLTGTLWEKLNNKKGQQVQTRQSRYTGIRNW
ncbi:hypothetical protein DER46DRAFT_132382 [Fusarium sp. MPI-SDFR-AT-0072]|nr:hypothetical protein DER46DRAFT_132382 [Fusarium sp. MPI-SDFR-AT-0072]